MPREEALEAFLLRNAALHVYELGDLHPPFAARCRWFPVEGNGGIRAVALRYDGVVPTLLCFERHDVAAAQQAVAEAAATQPRPAYAHVSPELRSALPVPVGAPSHHMKMGLHDPTQLPMAHAEPLGPADEGELLAFYEEAYPGNWFDPWMLTTQAYRGVRQDGRLVAVAGVHVVAGRCAALGNIAVHPGHRGQGLGSRVTAALCHALLGRLGPAATIGLNVHADNVAARVLYQRLGFVDVAPYVECALPE